MCGAAAADAQAPVSWQASPPDIVSSGQPSQSAISTVAMPSCMAGIASAAMGMD
jgi:hypothetical protein